MENTPHQDPNSRPPQRRRRKRTKWQNFKEAYLPVIIFAAVIVLIIWFIAGSFSRANESKEKQQETNPTPTENLTAAQADEAAQLMTQAADLAETYDYQAAVDVLASFSGDMSTIFGMQEQYDEYTDAAASLIPYTDVTNVPHLSCNTLMADLNLATGIADGGDLFNRNYITTTEFASVLQRLYDSGYVLVSVYDLAQKTTSDTGSVTMTPGTLYLPQGKKPIMLTLTDANYTSDMTAGFASRLVLDANGALKCEMTQSDGTVTTGDFDFIPILNRFIDEHPDFSYRGARATIAVCGAQGVFGYSTASEAASVIEAVKAEGYDFACYTYGEVEYGSMDVSDMEADLTKWVNQVAPALGEVDILVYPYGSDFTDDGSYTGEEYDVLLRNGFHYLIGTDSKTPAWGKVTDNFFLQTRRWISGRTLTYRKENFTDLFSAADILDANRANVPEA